MFGLMLVCFLDDILVSTCSFFLIQPLDVILSQDHNQVLALLEYVRYDMHPRIQLCSIKIMSVLRFWHPFYCVLFPYWCHLLCKNISFLDDDFVYEWQFSHGWACSATLEIQCCRVLDWGLCCLLRVTLWRMPIYWG